MPMSAEVTFLINLAMSECQDGSHWVAWGQPEASLPERRCWPFLLLTRHSKGNAGIGELAYRFWDCWGRFCQQKTQPSAGCPQLIAAHWPERKHAEPPLCSLKLSCLNSGLHLIFIANASFWAGKAGAHGEVTSVISLRRCYASWWMREKSLIGVWGVKLRLKSNFRDKRQNLCRHKSKKY